MQQMTTHASENVGQRECEFTASKSGTATVEIAVAVPQEAEIYLKIHLYHS